MPTRRPATKKKKKKKKKKQLHRSPSLWGLRLELALNVVVIGVGVIAALSGLRWYVILGATLTVLLFGLLVAMLAALRRDIEHLVVKIPLMRIEIRRGQQDRRIRGLIQVLGLCLSLVQGLRGNARLATWVIEAAARLLPAQHRERYLDEWLADLDQLRLKGQPLLGMAIRVLLGAPWIAAIRQGRDLGRSIEAEALGVRSPLWVGGLVTIVTFATIGAAIYLRQDPPTRTQVAFAVVASLGSGALAALHERKQQRSERRQHRPTRS